MKLTFNLDYRTKWGESLYLTGDIDVLGGGDYNKALKLRLIGESLWQLEIEVPDKTDIFKYRYFVRHENGHIKNEWGQGHTFAKSGRSKTFEIFEEKDGFYVQISMDKPSLNCKIINSHDLPVPRITECLYETPLGENIIIDTDITGKKYAESPIPGPVQTINKKVKVF